MKKFGRSLKRKHKEAAPDANLISDSNFNNKKDADFESDNKNQFLDSSCFREGKITQLIKYGLWIQFPNGTKGFLRRTNMISRSTSVRKILETMHLILDSLTEQKSVDIPLRFSVVPIRICACCNTVELSCKYIDVMGLSQNSCEGHKSDFLKIVTEMEDSYPYMLCFGCNFPLEIETYPLPSISSNFGLCFSPLVVDDLQVISSIEVGKFFVNQRVWIFFLQSIKKGLSADDKAIQSCSAEAKKAFSVGEDLVDALDLLGRTVRGCTVKSVSESDGETVLVLNCPGNLRAKAILLPKPLKTDSRNNTLTKKSSPTYERDAPVDGLIVDVHWATGEMYLLVDSLAVEQAPRSEQDFLLCNSEIQRLQKQAFATNEAGRRGACPSYPGTIIGIERNYVIVLLEITIDSKKKSSKISKRDSSISQKTFSVIVYVWYFNPKHYDVPWRTIGKEKTRLKESMETNPWFLPVIGDHVEVSITNIWTRDAPFYIGSFANHENSLDLPASTIVLPHIDDKWEFESPESGESVPHSDPKIQFSKEKHSTAPASNKKISKKTKEYIIDEIERSRRPVGFKQKLPQSTVEYEKALLSMPQSSYVWIRYIAFVLGEEDNEVQENSKSLTPHAIESARRLCERALSIIPGENVSERWNLWVAYLNIEVYHGTEESIDILFRKFVQESDDQVKSHSILLSLYEKQISRIASGEVQDDVLITGDTYKELAVVLLSKMILRFREVPDAWIQLGKFIVTSCANKDDMSIRILRNKILRTKKNSGDGAVNLMLAFRSLLVAALQEKKKELIIEVVLSVISFLYRCTSKDPKEDRQTLLSAARAQFEHALAFNPKKLTLIYSVYLDQEIRLLRCLHQQLSFQSTSPAEAQGDVKTQYHFIQNLFRRLTTLPINPRKMELFFQRFVKYEKEFGDASSLSEVKKYAEDYASRQLLKEK